MIEKCTVAGNDLLWKQCESELGSGSWRMPMLSFVVNHRLGLVVHLPRNTITVQQARVLVSAARCHYV